MDRELSRGIRWSPPRRRRCRGIHLCAVLAASVARCGRGLATAVLWPGKVGETDGERYRSIEDDVDELADGLAFIAAQVTFQSTAAAMSSASVVSCSGRLAN